MGLKAALVLVRLQLGLSLMFSSFSSQGTGPVSLSAKSGDPKGSCHGEGRERKGCSREEMGVLFNFR